MSIPRPERQEKGGKPPAEFHAKPDSWVSLLTFSRILCFRPHGMPLDVVSDRGTEFRNKFADAFFRALGTDLCKSTYFIRRAMARLSA